MTPAWNLVIPYTDDFNGPNMEGAGWHHLNVKDGKRHGANEAYIEPILGKRKNFTLSTNSYATRLLFEGKRCVGVEYVQNGQTKTARATREVIVAGGAIESPKLLMLSGIGPADHLKEHGIKTLVDLPGVGQNFHNHVLTGVIREAKQQLPPPNLNLSEVGAVPASPTPVGSGLTSRSRFCLCRSTSSSARAIPTRSASCRASCVRMSRGWIKLASADPADKPLVNPNYLGAASDRERLVQAVKLARDIFATKAFSDWAGRGTDARPGSEERTPIWTSLSRSSADSYHHQAGSCKMGSDEMAVVDPQLRVYGVEGLRVADASVFPVVPSGNCHAGILMIAEKCADMIKQAHGLS